MHAMWQNKLPVNWLSEGRGFTFIRRSRHQSKRVLLIVCVEGSADLMVAIKKHSDGRRIGSAHPHRCCRCWVRRMRRCSLRAQIRTGCSSVRGPHSSGSSRTPQTRFWALSWPGPLLCPFIHPPRRVSPLSSLTGSLSLRQSRSDKLCGVENKARLPGASFKIKAERTKTSTKMQLKCFLY